MMASFFGVLGSLFYMPKKDKVSKGEIKDNYKICKNNKKSKYNNIYLIFHKNERILTLMI